MNPTLRIGACDLYHGDAIKLLPALGVCADLVLTDPPYLLTSGGATTGGLHERFSNGKTKYDNSGQLVPCDIDWIDFMPLLYGALAARGHCYAMANNRNVQEMLNAAEASGFEFHNLLVWDKITATPNRWYMKNCEFIGFFYKGNAFTIADPSAKQLIRCPQVDETGHPTEKPVALMENYIRQSTKAGQAVLDPFMGSGSTGVAAVRAGRRFIGIEKDADFFAMAVDRIRTAVSQPQAALL